MANFQPTDVSAYDESNPYASPLTPADLVTPDDPHREINSEAEAMVLRAWRASIIGLVFLPFIAHLYSMYLLVHASATTTHFSPDGRRRFYLAFAVNVIAGALWGLVLGTVFHIIFW